MTGYEALKLCSGQENMLHALGINPNDCRYLSLFEDYMEMSKTPDKVSYIVSVLAEKYRVSERTVYSVMDRLQRCCKPLSA